MSLLAILGVLKLVSIVNAVALQGVAFKQATVVRRSDFLNGTHVIKAFEGRLPEALADVHSTCAQFAYQNNETAFGVIYAPEGNNENNTTCVLVDPRSRGKEITTRRSILSSRCLKPDSKCDDEWDFEDDVGCIIKESTPVHFRLEKSMPFDDCLYIIGRVNKNNRVGMEPIRGFAWDNTQCVAYLGEVEVRPLNAYWFASLSDDTDAYATYMDMTCAQPDVSPKEHKTCFQFEWEASRPDHRAVRNIRQRATELPETPIISTIRASFRGDGRRYDYDRVSATQFIIYTPDVAPQEGSQTTFYSYDPSDAIVECRDFLRKVQGISFNLVNRKTGYTCTVFNETAVAEKMTTEDPSARFSLLYTQRQHY